jgi:hypothetical protein
MFKVNWDNGLVDKTLKHLATYLYNNNNNNNNNNNTGWSKSLCAPDDYSTEQSPHNWWFEDGHHRIHSECRLCCTEHSLREHSSACQ